MEELQELAVTIEVRRPGMYHDRKETCELLFRVSDLAAAKENIRSAIEGLETVSIDHSYIRESTVVVEVSPGYKSVSTIGDLIEDALGVSELRL